MERSAAVARPGVAALGAERELLADGCSDLDVPECVGDVRDGSRGREAGPGVYVRLADGAIATGASTWPTVGRR